MARKSSATMRDACRSAVLLFLLHVSRGEKSINQHREWGAIFNRGIRSMTQSLAPESHWPFDTEKQIYELLANSSKPPFVVLEIGMGMGRALLESTGWLRRIGASYNCGARNVPQGGCRNLRSSANASEKVLLQGVEECRSCVKKVVCGVGITSIAYSEAMFAAWNQTVPDEAHARSSGQHALFVQGQMDLASMREVQTRFHTTMMYTQQLAEVPPVVVDADYCSGLPFLPQTFSFIYEQAALKFFVKEALPDPTRSAADYLRFLLDDTLRVLRPYGFAVFDLMEATPSKDCAPHASCKPGERLVASSLGWNRTDLEKQWMAKRLAKKLPLPFEIAIGAVAVRGATACAPARCTEHRPVCEATPIPDRHSSDEDSCVASIVYAASVTHGGMPFENTMLVVHKFLRGASDDCVTAAKKLAFFQQLLRLMPGSFTKETPQQASSISSALRRRINELRAIADNEEGNAETRQLHREHHVAGVKLWYREPKMCHLPEVRGDASSERMAEQVPAEAKRCSSAPRVSWSELQLFVPDLL